MSRCEEYYQKLLAVGDRISELKRELERIHTPDEYERINREIGLKEEEKASWNHLWEQSRKYGGC